MDSLNYLLELPREFWISSAVAVLIGVISTYFAVRVRHGVISVVLTRSANLVSEVIREVPNVHFSYKGVDFNEELVWLSGILRNVGRQDIGHKSVAQFPTLALSEGAEWKEFIIGKFDVPIKASGTIQNASTVCITWDLLKGGEGIPFNALIHARDRTVLRNLRRGLGLTVECRIESTSSEFAGEIPIEPEGRSAIVRSTIPFMLFLVMMALVTVGSMIVIPGEFQVGYSLKSEPGSLYLLKSVDESGAQVASWPDADVRRSTTISDLVPARILPRHSRIWLMMLPFLVIGFGLYLMARTIAPIYRLQRALNPRLTIFRFLWGNIRRPKSE